MDRIALSKRIGGLADVFANGSPIRRELEAMSYALEHMADERFATILNEGYEADKESTVRGFGTGLPVQKPEFAVGEKARMQRQVGAPDVPVFEPKDLKAAWEALMSDPQVAKIVNSKPALQQAMKEASAMLGIDIEKPEGNTWSREASEAVVRNLLTDVLGKEAMEKAVCCDTHRHLDKKQMPDAEKKQEKPATLTDEQTPKLSEALNSDMYKKSQGAVRKEATEGTSKEAARKKKVDIAAEPAAEPAPAPAPEAPKDEKPAPAPAPEAPKSEEPKEVPVAKQKAAERAEQKVEKTQEEAKEQAEGTAKALEKLDEMTQKTAAQQPDAMLTFDGIELGEPMAEVELTDEDKTNLGKLFE